MTEIQRFSIEGADWGYYETATGRFVLYDDHVVALKAKTAKLEEERAEQWRRRREALASVDLEKAINATLRAALEWYANPEIYRPHPHGIAFDSRDLSYHARAVLGDAA